MQIYFVLPNKKRSPKRSGLWKLKITQVRSIINHSKSFYSLVQTGPNVVRPIELADITYGVSPCPHCLKPTQICCTESILPTRINAVSLRSRLWALGSLGFPKSYDIFILNQNQQWELAGNFDFQPDAFGLVEIKLKTIYHSFGIKIVPTEVGTDNYGKYYFQLADLDIRFSEFN